MLALSCMHRTVFGCSVGLCAWTSQSVFVTLNAGYVVCRPGLRCTCRCSLPCTLSWKPSDLLEVRRVDRHRAKRRSHGRSPRARSLRASFACVCVRLRLHAGDAPGAAFLRPAPLRQLRDLAPSKSTHRACRSYRRTNCRLRDRRATPGNLSCSSIVDCGLRPCRAVRCH